MNWRAISWPWQYSVRPLPGPGTENLAFLDLQLERETPIGPGQANRRQFVSAPATYVPKMRGVDGIGGLLTGQIITGPLVQTQGR